MKKFLVMLLLLVLPTNYANANQLESGETTMGKVSMEGVKLDKDILKLSVDVEDMMAPVLGVAFHLIYQNEDLAFLKYQPGDFLERGGDPFYLVSNANSKLIFGQTLRREDLFPLGNGHLVDFYFQILNEDEMIFTFEKGVVSTLDTVRQDLNNIKWIDYVWGANQNSEGVGIRALAQNNLLNNPNIKQIFILISMVVFALMVAYFLIKNMGKKRPDSYVNFK